MIPISAPEPYECRERARLLFFINQVLFLSPTHTHTIRSFMGISSRPIMGENGFRLMLQNRMSTENAVGCLFFIHEVLFFVPHMHIAHSIRSSMGISNRICSKAGQVDFSTAEKSTRPAFEQILLEIPMEEQMLCVCVGQSKVPDQAKSSTPQRSLCSHGSGALIGIHFHPQTACWK